MDDTYDPRDDPTIFFSKLVFRCREHTQNLYYRGADLRPVAPGYDCTVCVAEIRKAKVDEWRRFNGWPTARKVI